MDQTITNVQESTELGATGQAIPSIRITFTVGKFGPFTVTIPKSEYTAVKANQKIQEFVSHIVGLQGVR